MWPRWIRSYCDNHCMIDCGHNCIMSCSKCWMDHFPTDLMAMVAQSLNVQDWLNLRQAFPHWSKYLGETCTTYEYLWCHLDMTRLVSLKTLIAPNVLTIIEPTWPPHLTTLTCPRNTNLTNVDVIGMPDSLTHLNLSSNQLVNISHLPNHLVHIHLKRNPRNESSMIHCHLPCHAKTIKTLTLFPVNHQDNIQWPSQLEEIEIGCTCIR